MRASRIAYGFLSAFIATIFALNGWQEPQYPTAVWIVLSVATVMIASLTIRKKHVGSVLLAMIIGIALGFVTVARATHVTTEGDIETFADGTISVITGHIVDAPDRRPLVTKYTVEANKIAQGISVQPTRGRILAGDKGGWPRFNYGEAVTIKGKLPRPEKIEDFDYPAYLRLKGIEAIMPSATLSPSNEQPLQGFTKTLQHTLITVRDRFEAQINSVLPEPHASLLA